MAFLDVTIVNVAFPVDSRGVPDASLAALSWVLNAYNIVFAALLVPAGRLADLLGRRRLFFWGLALFVLRRACAGSRGRCGCWCARVLQAGGARAAGADVAGGCCCRSSR
jgi:NTE family protein